MTPTTEAIRRFPFAAGQHMTQHHEAYVAMHMSASVKAEQIKLGFNPGATPMLKAEHYARPKLEAPPDPPPHIVGSMNGRTSQAIRDERDRWAANMAKRGYSVHQIGAALRIRYQNAHAAALRGGWSGNPPRTAREALE